MTLPTTLLHRSISSVHWHRSEPCRFQLPTSNFLPGEGIKTCSCPCSLTRIDHTDCSLRSVVARGQVGSLSTESNASPYWPDGREVFACSITLPIYFLPSHSCGIIGDADDLASPREPKPKPTRVNNASHDTAKSYVLHVSEWLPHIKD